MCLFKTRKSSTLLDHKVKGHSFVKGTESNSSDRRKMASSLDLLDCSICLHLLDEPVTIACGHSFCKKCINTFWDTGPNLEKKYTCPQCRTTFSPKPALQRNTVLANLLEEHKKKPSQSAAGDENDVALPGDVPCDCCTKRKQKAEMYCLMCLASFCETHLQPHFQLSVLKKHKLIQASTRIKESICSRHDRLFEIYCRTDKQLVCPLCVVQHKNHDIVEVTAEVKAKQVIKFIQNLKLYFCDSFFYLTAFTI